MQISNNVFIVTGGASGLGGATTRMLAAGGGKVVIADVQADRGEALARELGSARFVKCDVASEADGQALLAGGQAEPEGDMGLARAAGPEGNDVLAPFNPLAASQLQHLHLVELGDRLEVEAVQAFDSREPGGLDTPLDQPALPVDQFELDQAGKELNVIKALGGALPGQLLVFPEEGGQLQNFELIGQQDLRGLIHG